eukprot:PLAT14529.1.p1 GENE.PLAT14529.1~~PLAT14529.1.p1  ORF type:complete len:201 (+),score=71.42 PLAT14529.1:66-668(+)
MAAAGGGEAPVGKQRILQHDRSGTVIKIQNVVATINVQCTLKLDTLAQRLRNAEYNPRRFPACIIRLRDPKVTTLVFQSGKVVCTGGKSEDDSSYGLRFLVAMLKRLDFDAHFADFKVHNIVGSTEVPFPLRLEGLALEHDKETSYEPELFPGLIYRLQSPRVVLLLFVSGKAIITGASTTTQVLDAFEKVYDVLERFRK